MIFIISSITNNIYTGAVGIEPTPEVLETSVLPLNYAPILYHDGKRYIRTAKSKGSGFTLLEVYPLPYLS
jgi:hypothetical protein